MKYLLAILMFVATMSQAQSYTFTIDTNTCRISATGGGLLSYQFQADRIRYVDRHQNILVFDDRTTLALSDGLLANYPTTDSLKGQLDLWFLDCQGISDPVVPVAGATALLSNTRSITLDGSTEYVTVPDDNSLTFLNNDAFTWSMWVYAQEATDMYLVTKTPNPTEGEYLIGTDGSDNPYITLYDSLLTNFIGATSSSVLPENQWVHLAVSHTGSADSTDIVWYMDGVPTGQTAYSRNSYTAMHNLNTPVNIGSLGGLFFSEAELDNIAVWDDVLSLQEVKELSAIRDYNYHTDIDSLISWWGFDSPDSVQTGGIDDLKGANDGSTVNMTVADNFTECVAWPYDYLLVATDSFTNLTPMQSAGDTAFGGYGWNLDGINEFIGYTDNNLFSFGDGASTDSPFSGAVWCKLSDISDELVWWKTNEYVLGFTGEKLRIKLYDLNSSNTIERNYSTNLTYLENQWIHIGWTYDATGIGGLKLFLNGVRVDDTNVTLGTYLAMHNLTVPLSTGAAAAPVAGVVTDPVIFDVELTEAQMLVLYNDHTPINVNTTAMAGDIVGYWRGYNSDNTANGIIDQGPNGIDADGNNMEAGDYQYSYPRTFYDIDTASGWDFDGSTERIDIADANDLSFTDNQIHLSAFIRMGDATNHPIIYKEDEYLFWSNASDQLEARFIDASTGGYIGRLYSLGVTSYEGEWTFFEATFDGSNVDLRINGVVVDETDANSGSFTAMENTANGVSIAYDGTNNADGTFSNVSITGKFTDLCEGQEMYNDGSPVDPSAITIAADVVSHWMLNLSDDPSGTVNDIIGTNNGTAINTPQGNNPSYPTN